MGRGFSPAFFASSRVLYLNRSFSEIVAADLQSGRWDTGAASRRRSPPRPERQGLALLRLSQSCNYFRRERALCQQSRAIRRLFSTVRFTVAASFVLP